MTFGEAQTAETLREFRYRKIELMGNTSARRTGVWHVSLTKLLLDRAEARYTYFNIDLVDVCSMDIDQQRRYQA